MLALFLGLLKIAEESGIVFALVKLVRPILRPLFPEVPPDHPALGMIALNLTANVFGLGNAATPFGIKAMEELQKLNPTEDTATNSMVMLLAINTASVQLVPPVLLLALMGTQINTLIFPILITTGLGLIVAIVAARLLGRLPGYRASDPNRKALRCRHGNRAQRHQPPLLLRHPAHPGGLPALRALQAGAGLRELRRGGQGGLPGRRPHHPVPGGDPLRHRDVPGQRRDGGADPRRSIRCWA